MTAPDPNEVIATVRTLQDAVEVFRTMKDRLGLTFEFIDEVGGLSKGHADKVLSRTGEKRLGYDTFALFAQLFAVEFRVYVDPAAFTQMQDVWEQRKRPLYPPGSKPGRISKKLIAMAKPVIFSEMGKKSVAARMLCSTAEQRSRIARKAARKSGRLSKLPKEKRSAIAKKAAKARWHKPVILEIRE